MSIGKRSTEEAPTWGNGETGSAIGRPLRASNDGVRPKDMAEILDEGFGESQTPSIDNQAPRIIQPQCRDKQSWIKRLFQRCFSCKKMNLVSIATAMFAMQLQAYQTATVNGIPWKYEVRSDGSWIYGVYSPNNGNHVKAIPVETEGDIVIPDVLGGKPVVGIMTYAFGWCQKLKSVVVPDTVVSIGDRAFECCTAIEKIVLGKNVSTIGSGALHCKFTVYSYTLSETFESKLKTIIIRGGPISYTGSSPVRSTYNVDVYVSSSWTLPNTWAGYSVKYYDPIPAIGSAVAKNLKEALYGATDERLKSRITTETQYNNFRSWANGVVGTSDMAQRQTVKDSSFAWLSYALDADSLITKAPVQGEVSIERFAPNADEAKAFDLAVAIDGITVGANATAANLAEVFTIEGSTTPNGTYSSDDVEVTFGTPSEGKVKCTARPKDATKTSFFMKVKMNP